MIGTRTTITAECVGYERYLDYIRFADKTDVLAQYLRAEIYPAVQERSRPLKVLDIGGGTGRILSSLLLFARERGCEVQATVLEPAENAAQILIEQFSDCSSVEVVINRFEHWIIDNQVSFDLVIASHVMYYFHDRRRFVEDCLARVSAGGKLVLVATSLTILANELYQRILPTFLRRADLPRTDQFDGAFGFVEELELALFSLGRLYTASILPSRLAFPAELVRAAFEALRLARGAADQDLFKVLSFLWHYPSEILVDETEPWLEYLQPIVQASLGLQLTYEDKVIIVNS